MLLAPCPDMPLFSTYALIPTNDRSNRMDLSQFLIQKFSRFKKAIIRMQDICVHIIQLRFRNILCCCTVRYCCISAVMLTCFSLMMGRDTFCPLETIAASFLHLTVLFFKVIFNHTVRFSLVDYWQNYQ